MSTNPSQPTLFSWRPRKQPKPVGFARALAIVVQQGRAMEQSRRAEAPRHPMSVCPKCGTEGSVDGCFGYRIIDGKRRPQSWCRGCRSAHRRLAAAARTSTALVDLGPLLEGVH